MSWQSARRDLAFQRNGRSQSLCSRLTSSGEIDWRTAVCLSRRTMKRPMASASMFVEAKQFQASCGVLTIGSPRTLKLVLIRTGQPVCS